MWKSVDPQDLDRIREECNEVYTISKENFSFGFSSERGYILCSYDSPDQLTIELVCSDIELARELLKEAEKRASLLILYGNRKTWYESLGFVHRKTICLRRDVPNVHLMMKKI